MDMSNHPWRGERNNGLSGGGQKYGRGVSSHKHVSFSMAADDTEPDEEYKYIIGKKQGIRCRLLLKKYRNREAAEKRCREIHGQVFDGLFKSGRYWVFWEWEKRKCIF